MEKPKPKRRTPVAKAKKSLSNGEILLRVYGLLLITGLCGGFLLGKSYSPNFNDPTFSPGLIRSILRRDSTKRLPDREWHKEFLPDGRVSSFRPQRVILSYPCAITMRIFDSSVGRVDSVPIPLEKVETPRLGIGYTEAIGYLLGGTTITAVGTAQDVTAALSSAEFTVSLSKKVMTAAGGLMLAAVGVGVGYYLGFDDRVRCGDPLFKQMVEDPLVWRAVAEDFLTDHQWKVIYSDQLPPLDPLMRLWTSRSEMPKWAHYSFLSSLNKEQENVKNGVKFMRIEPYKNRRIGRLDFMSEGRLAGVLDWANPRVGKDGTPLSPVNLAFSRDGFENCNPCLPENLSEITDGVSRDVDRDLEMK